MAYQLEKIFKIYSFQKPEGLQIWYVTSSSGPLQRLFKLCPYGQKGPTMGLIGFIYSYIRKY